MAYLDGECGWLARRRAERLLARHPEAASFLNTQRALSGICRELSEARASQSLQSSADTWSVICARIEHEQRGARFLGARVDDAGRGSLFGLWKGGSRGGTGRWGVEWFGDRIAWGAAGALSTAVVVLALVPRGEISSPSAQTERQLVSEVSGMNLAQSAAPTFVAATGIDRSRGPVSNQLASAPRIIEERIPGTFEVDWVRSAGRVRMIQDPTERSAIIWVKRHDLARPSASSGVASRATAAATVAPNATPDLQGYE